MIFLSRKKLCIMIAAMLPGCAMQPPTAPAPLKPVDASLLYSGRWYEIGRTPMKLTDGCVAGTTDYVHATDGTLIERDACRTGTPAGKDRVISGKVVILNPGVNNEIKVHYILWGFIPITRVYWILDHDNQYQWFIYSNPRFTQINLFTRAKQPAVAQISALTKRAHELGYDVSKLEYPAEFPAD